MTPIDGGCDYERSWSAHRIPEDTDVVGISGGQGATRSGKIFNVRSDTVAFQVPGGLQAMQGILAVGAGGTIAEENIFANAWSLRTSPVTQDLNAIWYPWIAGSDGTILRFDGTDWLAGPPIGPEALRGIWATKTSAWAVGDGAIYLRANETWRREPSGDSGMWRAVSGQDDNNVWVVGAMGSILHWDGASWVAVSSGVAVDFNAVWTTPGSAFVWVAGNHGTILRIDVGPGHEVVAHDSPVKDDFFCIWNLSTPPDFPPEFPSAYCGSRGLVLTDRGEQLVGRCESP